VDPSSPNLSIATHLTLLGLMCVLSTTQSILLGRPAFFLDAPGKLRRDQGALLLARESRSAFVELNVCSVHFGMTVGKRVTEFFVGVSFLAGVTGAWVSA
jgi:hypothetical protein